MNNEIKYHSEAELKVLLTEKSRFSRIWQAYEVFKDNEDFCDYPFREQLYLLMENCIEAQKEARYEVLKGKSLIPKPEILPTLNEIGKRNHIRATRMDLLTSKITDGKYHRIIITGNSGVGKTTFGLALLNHAMMNGLPSLFLNYPESIGLMSALSEKNSEQYKNNLKEMLAHRFLMLDDFLLTPPTPQEIFCLHRLIDLSEEKNCSLIFTSQYEAVNWLDRLCQAKNLEDDKNAHALVDRLITDPIMINLKGASKRSRSNTIVINGGDGKKKDAESVNDENKSESDGERKEND